MTRPADCPRCGTSPIEIASFGAAEPEWTPGCGCYPKSPSCPTCHQPIEDGRCATLGCALLDVLIPLPDIDPLHAP